MIKKTTKKDRENYPFFQIQSCTFTAILNSGVKCFCFSHAVCYSFSLSREHPLFIWIGFQEKKNSRGGISPGIPLNTDNYQTLNSPFRCHCKKHQRMYEKQKRKYWRHAKWHLVCRIDVLLIYDDFSMCCKRITRFLCKLTLSLIKRLLVFFKESLFFLIWSASLLFPQTVNVLLN